MLMPSQNPELISRVRAPDESKRTGQVIKRLRHGLSHLPKKPVVILGDVARRIPWLDQREAFLGQSLEHFVAFREGHLGTLSQFITGEGSFSQECVISLGFVLI